MALACFGLANKVHAGPLPCKTDTDCKHLGTRYVCCPFSTGPICILKPFCGGHLG
jgi:hypothetical protein